MADDYRLNLNLDDSWFNINNVHSWDNEDFTDFSIRNDNGIYSESNTLASESLSRPDSVSASNFNTNNHEYGDDTANRHKQMSTSVAHGQAHDLFDTTHNQLPSTYQQAGPFFIAEPSQSVRELEQPPIGRPMVQEESFQDLGNGIYNQPIAAETTTYTGFLPPEIHIPTNASPTLSKWNSSMLLADHLLVPPRTDLEPSALSFEEGHNDFISDDTTVPRSPPITSSVPRSSLASFGPRMSEKNGVRPKRSIRKRAETSEEAKRKTQIVKNQGACLLCRVNKDRCDGNSKCASCNGKTPIFPEVCYREPLTKVIAFRAGNSRANQEISQLPIIYWDADDELEREISVQFPFASAKGIELPKLQLICKRFVPRKGFRGDVLTDVWEGTDGSSLVINFPAFACTSLTESTVKEEHELIKSNLEAYFELCSTQFEADMNAMSPPDMISITIREAIRFSTQNPKSCIGDALKIRRIAHFSRDSMIIVSQERLGIPEIDDQRYSIYGQTPVPSVLDFQIDTLAIEIMRDLLNNVVKRLTTILFKKTGDDTWRHWHEVYLACFILLNCLESVFELQRRYLGIHENDEGKQFLSKVEYITGAMWEKWEYSAGNILHHFRAIVRGLDIFQRKWDMPWEDLKKDHVLRTIFDTSSAQYMKEAYIWIKANSQLLLQSRQQFGKPLFWLSQLFMSDFDYAKFGSSTGATTI